MEDSRFDRFVTVFEYFPLAGGSMTQTDCDDISSEFKNWLDGQIPCSAELIDGKVQVAISQFSQDSGLGLGTELFVHLSRTALRKLNTSIAYNILETRSNL